MLSLDLGTTRGGVPSARIAAYKICWSDGCYDADVLAAFDDAIADGVDIISFSVGGGSPKDYFNDFISIGAFHAMKKGILTSMSAGNDGPDPFTIRNFSPWSLSVAASTTDRRFLTGVTINTFDLNGTQYPLVYAGDIPNITAGFNGSMSRLSILAINVKTSSLKGAIGIIMQDSSPKDLTFSFPLPASHLGTQQAFQQQLYQKVQKGSINQPLLLHLSLSRGPNPITPDILKPDLTGPGVAYSSTFESGRR